MKNKLTIILSAALAVTGIVAIVAPTVIAVTSQQKIDTVEKEKDERESKTIASLAPTKAFTDLVEAGAANPAAAATAVNAVTDKTTLFTITSANEKTIAHADAIEGAIGAATVYEDAKKSGQYLVNFPITWKGDYYLSVDMLDGASLVWGQAASVKSDFNDTVNTADFSKTEVIANTALETALNVDANKAIVQGAINNGDQLDIGTIAVAAADADGFEISIPFTPKDGVNIVFTTSPLTVNFKVEVEVKHKTNETDLVNAIKGVTGVSAATSATDVQTALNDNGKTAILAQLDFPTGTVTAIDSFTVDDLDPVVTDTYKITITYTMANGYVQSTDTATIVIENAKVK